MKKVLAIDMGATSIRGIIGYICDGKIIMEEVMRFHHEMQTENGRLCWDYKNILANIVGAIEKQEPGSITSIAVDTWGVDFGMIGADEELLTTPIAYRDPLSATVFDDVIGRIPGEKLFEMTGNQIMDINTLFQIEAIKVNCPEIFANIYKILLTPDLINYLLTGQVYAERSIASTTQLFDLTSNQWNFNLIDRLGYSRSIFPSLIDNMEQVGTTKNSKIPSLRQLDIPVVSVASHDTASAVFVTSAYTDSDTMFLSSGTWSLIGACTDAAVISDRVYQLDLTNEIGFMGKNMFFRNITGLFILDKARKELGAEVGGYSFDDVTSLAQKSDEFVCFVDVDYKDFTGTGSVLQAITDYASKTSQPVPKTHGQIFRCILESLVLKYYETILAIEECSGKVYPKLQIIGGGSKDELLCQMTADLTGKEVVAGPKEATGLGNITAQLIACGEISDVNAARKYIANSCEQMAYSPTGSEKWRIAYEKSRKILHNNK